MSAELVKMMGTLVGNKEISKKLAEAGLNFADAAKNGLAEGAEKLNAFVTQMSQPALTTLMATFTSATATDQADLMISLLNLAQSEGVQNAVGTMANLFSILIQGGVSSINALTAFSNAFASAADADGKKSGTFGSLKSAMEASTDKAGANLDKLQATMDKAGSTDFETATANIGTLLGNLIRITGIFDIMYNSFAVSIVAATKRIETIFETINDWIEKIKATMGPLWTGVEDKIIPPGTGYF